MEPEETQSTVDQTAQGDTNAGEGTSAPEVPPVETPAGGEAPPETSWLDSLPDDLKTNEAFKDIKDVGELAKKYSEALSKVHEAPEKPEDYEFTVPEGHQVNQEFVTAMKHIAHESGVSKTQMKSMAEKFMTLESLVLKQREKDNAAAWDALKLNLTDKFDESVALAEKAAKTFAGDGFAKEIREKKVHPRAIEVWSKIGKAISDDTVIDGEAVANKPSIPRTRDGQAMLSFK